MSDDSTNGTGAPAPQVQTQQTPAVAAATTPAAASAQDDPAWLPERLSRAQEKARQALLAELGVDDPAKAKAAIAAAKKAEDEAKSLADRIADTTSKLTKVESDAERYRAVTVEFAERQMLGLSPEQQAAVKAIAGDDAAAQLRAITALTPTWAKSAAQTTAAPAAPARPPVPASGTAPQPNAPDGASVSTPNHREVFAALQKTNPFAAANYGLAHAREVFPENQ